MGAGGPTVVSLATVLSARAAATAGVGTARVATPARVAAVTARVATPAKVAAVTVTVGTLDLAVGARERVAVVMGSAAAVRARAGSAGRSQAG